MAVKFIFDINKLKALANTPIPDKDFIILKYTKNTWYGSPRIWWNSMNKYAQKLSPFYRQFVLPDLSSRPYIHVIDPFMKVIIDAKEKGSLLTIDDILFATRALSLDATRSYDRFRILNETLHTLSL